MRQNNEIINTITTRISILKNLIKEDKSNEKEVVKNIISAYKLLQKYSYDKNLYSKEIEFYEELDDDNINLRFKNSKEYFNLIEKELDFNYREHNIKICDEKNNLAEINILTNSEGKLAFVNGVDTLFESIEKSIGKDEIFIEYKGELDNTRFMDFEDYASNKSICMRIIFTKDSTIYYYGGKDYENVLTAIDNISEYAKTHGVNFNVENYQKKK